MSVLKGYLDRFGVPTASDSTILELVREKHLGKEKRAGIPTSTHLGCR